LKCGTLSFFKFEGLPVPKVYGLGKLFISLFLTHRLNLSQSESLKKDSDTKCQGLKSRLFGTIFGKVRYWRTYIYSTASSGGYYPLDIEPGLPLDGFSMALRSHAARLATKMSYSQAVSVLVIFLNWTPCQKTVEETVLGLGRHTQQWFESAPAPENDGDVLIIFADSWGNPMATEEELKKRRVKRGPDKKAASQRHRGRKKRKKRGREKRKKKGDKSKNAKMATIIVIHTLKRGDDGRLEGPINKKVYASYAPKRHAIAIARREADKRGFTEDSGKQVRVVTDGDNDLERYIEEFFPSAIHTIDVFHVTEYIWEAGRSLYKEGSEELEQWVEELPDALYDSRVSDIIKELERRLRLIPKKGPGNKGRRERLTKAIRYLKHRIDKMDYKNLQEQDLEISSGAVEGAVKNVIAKRFDNGGMRWIKERSEALLQLRCIEVNDDWDEFISYVHGKFCNLTQQNQKNLFLKSSKADPLPRFGINRRY